MRIKFMKRCVFALASIFSLTSDANILLNPSFEDVPGTGSSYEGQGILPTDWLVTSSSPDTYSDNYVVGSSFGLPPGVLNNFTGVTAQDGHRWVAGWSTQPENFGQTLQTPLTANATYSLSGYLHQALRSDINNPGGYNIYLTAANHSGGVLLGTLGYTTGFNSGWEAASFTFTAPANASSLPFLLFVPVSATSAYPGLDNLDLSMVAVPEPSTYFAGVLLLLPLAAQMIRRSGAGNSLPC